MAESPVASVLMSQILEYAAQRGPGIFLRGHHWELRNPPQKIDCEMREIAKSNGNHSGVSNVIVDIFCGICEDQAFLFEGQISVTTGYQQLV